MTSDGPKIQRDSIRRRKDRIVKKFVSLSRVESEKLKHAEMDEKRRELVKKMKDRQG
jgi:hypothetical protein